MFILSQSGDKLITFNDNDSAMLVATKTTFIGDKTTKGKKYAITATKLGVNSELSVSVIGAYDTEKEAYDSLAMVYDALAKGTQCYKMQ